MHSAAKECDDAVISSLLLLLQPLPADVQRAFLGRIAERAPRPRYRKSQRKAGFFKLVGPPRVELGTNGL